MDTVRFPKGLKYEGFGDQNFAYPTVNAGQSAIIGAFDKFFDVEHLAEN